MREITRKEWAKGYGPIQHSSETAEAVATLVEGLGEEPGDGVPVYQLLHAADRLAAASMWLVVHMTYALEAPLSGRPLAVDEFKPTPEGHTGGSLNMVPGYVGYLAANVLSGRTRSWVMGQGHCVAAIDSVNLLAGNTTEAHANRYGLSDPGLRQFVRDFYAYRLTSEGKTESPLGSHVNAQTAGGTVEGGYLGFTELQYIHMPLKGETLVAFLSDGAWEEQRGSDWAPRWWRAEDSGAALPIMIHNGRRIDQRSTLEMEGGPVWLQEHLRLNDFDPFVFDGRDPAAFVCAIFEMERRLDDAAARIRNGAPYPVKLPYGIAVAPKGAGFEGEGTNNAHNLPLGANPAQDEDARRRFNESARKLQVPANDLREAVACFQGHNRSGRPRERDHALATRHVTAQAPELPFEETGPDRFDPGKWQTASPMAAVDTAFLAFVKANRHLRPRAGNPDEMESNHMKETLAALKFRAPQPEPGRPEDVHGAVITALNEEAVAAAAVGNKGGINIIVTYEAFATKMQGMLRQEITFSNGLTLAGRPPGWLSVPVILTSQAWENSKNEYSHQDPSLPEAMLGEPSHVSRVLFPADWNTAAAALRACYETHGQIWTVVAPKGKIAKLFNEEEARRLLRDGAIHLPDAGHDAEKAKLCLTAIGGYQIQEVLKASSRLRSRGVAHRTIYMMEPSRFRIPRSRLEQAHVAGDDAIQELYPDTAPSRVFMTHTRPEPVLGLLGRIHTGRQTTGIGFRNDGGTLDVNGMLWVNGCTWAHCLRAASAVLDCDESAFLTDAERQALDGKVAPDSVLTEFRGK